MVKPNINATKFDDGFYVTWQIVYSMEDAEAELFKVTAEHPGAAGAIRNPLFVMSIMAVFAAATVLFWSLGSSFVQFFMVGTATLFLAGSVWYFSHHRHSASNIDELQSSIMLYTDFIRDCQDYLHEISMVPPMYWDSEILHELYTNIETGQAGSLSEAVRIYENKHGLQLIRP